MLPGHGMTVLERQQVHLRWQGQNGHFGPLGLEPPNQLVRPDMGLGSGWPELGRVDVPGPAPGIPNLTPKQSSFKKRKFDIVHDTKVDGGGKDKNEDEESKVTEQSKNTKGKRKTSVNCSSKENSKASSEVQKTDYIHVRARRGQATDSHSLAERARREKISERMKYLQDLVPGCNKITGKAGMLDEIINYVQSLQRQVEFLSMKLAVVNPTFDLNIDSLLGDLQAFPPNDALSEINGHPIYSQSNPMHQAASLCLGLELGINTITGHRSSTSVNSQIPETFLDPSLLSVLPSSIWESDLHNLYNVDFFEQGRAPSLVSHQFTAGSNEVNNLKMEM